MASKAMASKAMASKAIALCFTAGVALSAPLNAQQRATPSALALTAVGNNETLVQHVDSLTAGTSVSNTAEWSPYPVRASRLLLSRSPDAATGNATSRARNNTVRLNTSSSHRGSASPWWAPVASAVIPGAGQFAMGQQRSVAYLVSEVYLLVQGFAARTDYQRDRNEYRHLAADVARRNFGTAKPDGDWDYYERMEYFDRSGRFDLISGGAVDPETDETTFNGNRWLFARETYWYDSNVAPADTSVEYANSMAFYLKTAIRDEFGWSWRDAQLQKDVYRQIISSANRNDQRAKNLFGVVGANHLVSMIDAYVSVRVRRYGGVRVGGLQLDGMESVVQSIGDPADGRRRIQSSLRFVPSSR